MKLSDKKIYKIKGNNNSRKKLKLRKKRTKHYKSKRRHQKKQDLKRKTMKIYAGGAKTCISENFKLPDNKTFATLTNEQRLELAKEYFIADSNMDCLEDTKKLIIDNLTQLWNSRTKSNEDQIKEHINTLRTVWEDSLTKKKLDTAKDSSGTGGIYNIGLSDIIGKTDVKLVDHTAEKAKGLDYITNTGQTLPKLPIEISTNIPTLVTEIQKSIDKTDMTNPPFVLGDGKKCKK